MTAIEACKARISAIEQALWHEFPLPGPLPQAGEGDEGSLREFSVLSDRIESYQAAFRQLEQLIAEQGNDDRHKFVIVIPVADRPQHLQSCLDSLLHLCRAFGYGGFADGRYGKVSVVIADDSKDGGHIARNKEIASYFSGQGIETLYFGLDEQLAQIGALSADEQKSLARILGSADRKAFYHKGPSLMRNIAYLKLNEIGRGAEKILFYFIDSDQEFRVKVGTPAGDRNIYAINYLYDLDRIFSETGAAILTGKVVGDPPVSPAVMAGNFLEDVIGFLDQIAVQSPSGPCEFHGASEPDGNDASYHDMAALFGFASAQAPYRYRCTLSGEHDNAACFSHFSRKLSRFFYGEHPTRKTYYRHEDLIAGIRPARTIYTGNYIFKPEGLKYFIPFAPLKLRMAGPVLGRLIKSALGDRFVSANLPMLHKRTVRATGQAEFRPGIAADAALVDLAGEFERQFYGDVMLFTMEKLTAMGYPEVELSAGTVADALAATHAAIELQYGEKRQLIQEKLNALRAIAHDPDRWWNRSAAYADAVGNCNQFIDNIAHNFGDRAYANIAAGKAQRHAEIAAAITGHAEDEAAWGEVLARLAERA
ncbi:MAG: hypothetical protein PHX38_02160 [Sulfuricella sp.]|nr:hypothetical protein [Sulfuricella sp.]